MAMLPLDPTADAGRRAWTRCPACADHEDCAVCLAGRTCPQHWRYLLSNEGSLLHLQCSNCAHMWAHETGFGAGSRGSCGPS